MNFFKNHFRLIQLYIAIPLAFTNATKQRIQKKIRLLLKDLDIITVS